MTTYDTQRHIHLYLTTTTFDHATSQFHVSPEGLANGPGIVAAHKRALDGTGHLHTLTSQSTGAPVKFRNVSMIIVATQAEFDTLVGLQGCRCYYFPNRHMDDNVAHVGESGTPVTPGYRVVMMPIGEHAPVDAPLEYWHVAVQLLDDEAAA